MNIYWSGDNTTHSFWVRLVSVSTIISTKFCFFKFVEMWKDESFTDVTIATEKKIFQVGNFFWNVKTEGFVTVSVSGAQVDIVSLQSLLQTPIFQLVSSASSDCDTEGGNISIKNVSILFLHLFCQEVPEEHVSLLLEYMYCGSIYVEQGYWHWLSLFYHLLLFLFLKEIINR